MNFDPLKQYIEQIDSNVVPGCEIAVYQNHQELFHHTAGFSNVEKNRKAGPGDLYFLYSASKLFTCTAGAQLLERGLLKLEDPVCKYLPEFGELYVKEAETVRPAKTVLTVGHLFTMCGGLTYGIGDEKIVAMRKQTNNQATTRQMVSAIAKMPLIFDPGAQFQYSLCHDVLAAVIEVVSGMRFGEYLKQHVFTPLGISEMTFQLNNDVLKKMSAQYVYSADKGISEPVSLTCAYALSEGYESGGAGLIGSAQDYILLPDALANGGVGKTGNRILKPETIDFMRQNHLNNAQLLSFTQKHPIIANAGYSYGLGVRTKIKQNETNRYSPIGEFGWDGAAGAYVLVDPENRLSIFYVQHVRGCALAYGEIHPTIRDLTYQALDE